MNTLFGLSMTAIMIVLLVLFAACLGAVAAIALSNRIMFRMGMRNVRRRRTQTALIVVGLMLATLIVTAAFVTGDSLSYSITNVAYTNLQRTDLALHHFHGGNAATTASLAQQAYVDQTIVPALQAHFQGDREIAGFVPALHETLPVLNTRTNLSEPAAQFVGDEPAILNQYSGLLLADGGRADVSALSRNQVFVDQKAAKLLDARPGDVLTTYAQGRPWQFQVAGIVKNQRAAGDLNYGPVTPVAGIAISLSTLQQLTGHQGQINDVDVALRGDVHSGMQHSDAAASKLEALSNSDQGSAVLGIDRLSFTVEKVKQDGVHTAETIGNVFTTIFIVLGLFSIAAGVMLIFTIFVMLAAERRTEMGIARAIGASRVNLVQTFAAEGMAYDLLAGVVGAAIGVAAAVWLIVGGTNIILGDKWTTAADVTPRSLVISYTLGVVLTFVTVVLSALRISRLNIVAAVRGSDERRRRERRQRTHWRWVAAGLPALILPPLGLYWLLRKGFGFAWTWILGPAGIMLGVLLAIVGRASEQLFPFMLGMSVVPLCVALILTYYRASTRAVWTATGLYLGVLWLLPIGAYATVFGHFEPGGMEMFVLSGIMIVVAFTLMIVFNARLLNRLVAAGNVAGSRAYRTAIVLAAAAAVSAFAGFVIGSGIGGLGQLLYLLTGLLALSAALAYASARFPWFAPALKMGVAYPLANRFRTGMTIAMFSLVVFALTLMSVINADMLKLFATPDAHASWDVIAQTDRNNPVPDLVAALHDAGSPVAAQIVAAGHLTATQWYGAQEVRQPNRDQPWTRYSVVAGDAAFFDANRAKLEDRARGYASDAAVYQAIKSQPNLAVVDFGPFNTSGTFSALGWLIQGVKFSDHAFDPFPVEFRDPVTGTSTTVTIIGVLSARIPTGLLTGVLTNAQTFAAVYGQPDFLVTALRLPPGVDGDRAAKVIKATLVTRGVQALSIKKLIDDGTAMSVGLLRIFQVFLALGLFVGIAGLGVIAFRSVVERRQQIGMLRAIGYQRPTVTLSFLLESGFIAVMGIASGVVGALVLARNLLTSNYFGTAAPSFFIPWQEIIVFVAVAFGFALLMTWWPSRRAANVPIAAALRYE